MLWGYDAGIQSHAVGMCLPVRHDRHRASWPGECREGHRRCGRWQGSSVVWRMDQSWLAPPMKTPTLAPMSSYRGIYDVSMHAYNIRDMSQCMHIIYGTCMQYGSSLLLLPSSCETFVAAEVEKIDPHTFLAAEVGKIDPRLPSLLQLRLQRLTPRGLTRSTIILHETSVAAEVGKIDPRRPYSFYHHLA